MSFIKDFIPIFKKNYLVFVEKRQEVGDMVTFFFQLDKKVDWKSGQHGIFSIKHVKVEGKAWRAFSIASTPKESTIMISMHISEEPSPYKKALLDLKAGDTILMRGPFGPFYIRDVVKPKLFIAGGVGITPFRALLQDVINNEEAVDTPIKILYSQSQGKYLYQQEFDSIVKERPLINIEYLNNRSELLDKIDSYTKQQGNHAEYFIAGVPDMVKSIKETLEQSGINKKNIKNDMFIGY